MMVLSNPNIEYPDINDTKLSVMYSTMPEKLEASKAQALKKVHF